MDLHMPSSPYMKRHKIIPRTEGQEQVIVFQLSFCSNWSVQMPRFYFNVRKGDQVDIDPEGEELPSYEMAVEEAVKAARELLAARVAKGTVVDGDLFEITNESGEVLGQVPFKSVLRLK